MRMQGLPGPKTREKILNRLRPVQFSYAIEKKLARHGKLGKAIAIASATVKENIENAATHYRFLQAAKESVGRPHVAREYTAMFDKEFSHDKFIVLLGKIRIPKGLTTKQKEIFRKNKTIKFFRILHGIEEIASDYAFGLGKDLKGLARDPRGADNYVTREFYGNVNHALLETIRTEIGKFARMENPTEDDAFDTAMFIAKIIWLPRLSEELERFINSE